MRRKHASVMAVLATCASASAFAIPTFAGAVTEGAWAFCQGGAAGYAGIRAVCDSINLLGFVVNHVQPNKKVRKRQAVEDTTSSLTTVTGRWLLDAERSESLEPFLIAVGAPKLIARLVGNKGKPVTLTVHEEPSGSSLTVATEGKETETMSTASSTSIQTPRGSVSAHVSGDVRRGFTVTKSGPTDGEVVTEVRELADGGRSLRCTFTHIKGGAAKPVVVTRYYNRA